MIIPLFSHKSIHRAALLFIVFFYSLCSFSQHTVHKIRIDPDHTFGGSSSDFFEQVDFIILESKKASMFGRIYQMEIAKEKIFIYDAETESVLIFREDGAFHAKIQPRSAKEYLGTFCLNREEEQIVIRSFNKLLKFNFDGAFIDEFEVPFKFERFFILKDGTFVFNLPRNSTPEEKDSTKRYDVGFTKDFHGDLQHYFQYDPRFQLYDYNLPRHIFSGLANGNFIYSFPYSYTIYEMNESGIKSEYQFLFTDKYSLPQGFSTDSVYVSRRKEYVFNPDVEHLDKYTFLGPAYKHDNYLLFHAEKVSNRLFSQNSDFIYDLDSKKAYSLNKLSGDSISMNLPVLQTSLQQEFELFFDGVLYSSMPAAAFNNMLTKLNVDRTKIDERLLDLDKTGNPVLIVSKLK